MLIRDLVLQNPRAIPVLQRYGIDFCCGGDQDFAEACAAQELDPQAVLAEVVVAPDDGERDWMEAPLAELIDHIEVRFHGPLRQELVEIEALARRVANAHRVRHGEQLGAVLEAFLELRAELLPHLQKEEEIVFPWIRGGGGPWIPKPLELEIREHEASGRALRHIRSLCDDFDVPPHACPSWEALWRRLEDLEKDLHRHIHLENNVLFPRALQGE